MNRIESLLSLLENELKNNNPSDNELVKNLLISNAPFFIRLARHALNMRINCIDDIPHEDFLLQQTLIEFEQHLEDLA